MTKETVQIYTDASYCARTNVAACGYLMRGKSYVKLPVVYTVSDIRSHEAEMYAVILAVKDLLNAESMPSVVKISSDAVYLIKYLSKREGLTKSKLRDQLDTVVAELRSRCNRVNFFYVRGHVIGASRHNDYLNEVDQACRKRMKEERTKVYDQRKLNKTQIL